MRILVIFTVGLISRILVNLAFDIDVFKEYINLISLTYYGFMAGLVGYFSNISSICLNFRLITNIIKKCCEDIFLDDKMRLGNEEVNFNKTYKTGEFRDGLFYNKDRNNGVDHRTSRNSDGEYRKMRSKRPAAGLRALYDPALQDEYSTSTESRKNVRSRSNNYYKHDNKTKYVPRSLNNDSTTQDVSKRLGTYSGTLEGHGTAYR
jgi:hypothetical protein